MCGSTCTAVCQCGVMAHFTMGLTVLRSAHDHAMSGLSAEAERTALTVRAESPKQTERGDTSFRISQFGAFLFFLFHVPSQMDACITY